MLAEARFTPTKHASHCRFNRQRSLRQFVARNNRLSKAVWEELQQTSSLSDYQHFIESKLREAGNLFVVEDGQVVSHRYLLIYRSHLLIEREELDASSNRLLAVYLNMQYDAWQELCRICRLYFADCPSYYQWKGKAIELLELTDALWSTGQAYPLTNEKTKRKFFSCILGFFNLPMPAQLYRKLGEIGKRSQVAPFLKRLLADYHAYRERLEE